MIYFLYGANTFEIDRALGALLDGLDRKYPDVIPERLDAAELEPSNLPDIVQGISLFDERRIVVLRSPSAHKALWSALEEYVRTIADTTDLIIVDPGADKRTKTFKALQKAAQSHEYPEFGPRGSGNLQKWLAAEAARRGLGLPRESLALLTDRVGYDQWALANAVEKLALVEDGSPERIRELIEPSPSASVFDLFEAAIKGQGEAVRAMLADLQVTADPHALVGLLSAQAYQLALVAHSTKSPAELGKVTGMSAYPLQKLAPIARTMTKTRVRAVIDAIAECDRDLKRSLAPPWTLITRAVLKIIS